MNLQELVTVLEEHVEFWDSDCCEHNGCSCGWNIPEGVGRWDEDNAHRKAWRRHVAEAVLTGEGR